MSNEIFRFDVGLGASRRTFKNDSLLPSASATRAIIYSLSVSEFRILLYSKRYKLNFRTN